MRIVLDGAVIGTVGITGSPAQVVRLGRLVQRQTEILLRESMFQRTRLLRENRLTQLVRDIVEFDPRILDEQIIRATGVELGYDLGQQRVAVLFEVQHGPESYPSSVRAIGEVFDARTDIVAELAAGRYVVLHHPSADDAEHLRSCVRRAAALLRERHGVVVHIGIGESGSGVAALAASCADAKDALRLAGDSAGVEIRAAAAGDPPQHGDLPARQDFALDRARRPRARGGDRSLSRVPHRGLTFPATRKHVVQPAWKTSHGPRDRL
jgi:carbohydrate diacid regulator